MTVPNETGRSGPYPGNGVTTVFPYDFRILDEKHITVIRLEANGAESTLVLNTDYIVSGVGDPGGGNIATVTPPAADQSVTFLRNVPFLQNMDLENQGAYLAENVEAAFDLATMRDQQLSERLDRAVTIPASSDPSSLTELVEDILRLADSAAAIDTVAGISGHVSTVAGIAPHVTTVAGVSTAVSTVAGIAGDVSVVSANEEAVQTAADNIAAIIAAPGHAQAAIDAETGAVAAQQAAEAAAAGVNLPPVVSGDEYKSLLVNAGASGYQLAAVPLLALNRAAIKALPANVLTLGVVHLGEAGREGNFKLKVGAPPVSDTQEGIYIVSNTAGYYWERVYSGYANVRWFGAKLDGATNDSAAIQGALDVAGNAFVPYTLSGFVADNIVLGTAKTIIGERKVRWKTTAAASYAVRVTAFMADAGTVLNMYSYIENFVFDLAASPVTTTAIRMGTADRVVHGLRVKNVDGKSCGEFYGEEAHATNYVVEVQFNDCAVTETRGRQVYSRRSRGFFVWRDFHIHHSGLTQVTWEGARFEDMIGLELEQFDVGGPNDALVPDIIYQPTATGLVISGAGAGTATVWLTRILIDTTRGPGILINNVRNVKGLFVESYFAMGNGIELRNVVKSTFTNSNCFGTVGRTGAPPGAAGVYMTGCQDVTFDGLSVEGFTGSGVVMHNCTDCRVVGGYSRANSAYGYFEDGAATRNLRQGVSSIGNGLGSLFQIGAQSATVGWYPNSGVFTASTVGATTIT